MQLVALTTEPSVPIKQLRPTKSAIGIVIELYVSTNQAVKKPITFVLSFEATSEKLIHRTESPPSCMPVSLKRHKRSPRVRSSSLIDMTDVGVLAFGSSFHNLLPARTY